MITYNGNEMMLQNDMGNTRILDSATGNIMGLSPGFIPIGMKEHGGIMYIASVDKEGNGEIGTIPSPIIRDFYKDRVIFEVGLSIPINSGDPIQISNKLYPADKFIANLQMIVTETDLIGRKFKKNSGLSPSPDYDPSDIILGRDVIQYTTGLVGKKTLYTPVLSYNSNISEILLKGWLDKAPLFSSKGIYSLELYSRYDNSSDIPASFLSSPLIYQYNDEFKESNYWYLHTDSPTDVFPKDLLTATLNQDLKQFPSNNKPGYLAVKLLTEGINKFDILPRAKYPFYTPITYKSYQSESGSQYYTYFPGFYYSTDSGIYIDRIEARVIDESTAKDMKLDYPYSTTIPQFTVNDLEKSDSLNSFLDNPELNDLFKNNGNTDHMYNALSNMLPQVQSVSDDKSFILTTLKQIEDHNQTDMESSTEGENKTYSGVFCVPLGEKYNNWYRAEIDYYDLYNNKQGTFTKRFNPYLNDIFGTNLSVGGKTYGNKLAMGPESIQISGQIDDTYTINTKGKHIYFKSPQSKSSVKKVGTNWEWDEMVNVYYTLVPDGTTHNKFQYTADSLSYEIKPSIKLNTNVLYLSTDSPSTTYSSTDSLPTISLPLHHGKSKFILSSPGKYLPSLAKIFMGGNINISYKFNSGCDVENAPGTAVFTLFVFDSLHYYFNNSYTGDQAYLNTFTICAFGGDYIDTEESLSYNYNMDTTFNGTVNINNDKITVNFSPSVDGQVGTLYRLGQTTEIINDGDFGYNGERVRWCYDSMLFLVKVPLNDTTTIQNIKVGYTNTYTPSYSIIPYFCLTGTNDEGKQVYVQRFGKKDNTDIVYEHNFELDTDGKPVNYYAESSDSFKSIIHPCTYTHEHPFYYLLLKLSYTSTLQPGIYVLNIQRVPGVAKLLLNTIFHQDAVLKIDIGNISRSFNAETGWVIQPSYNEGITNQSNIEVYSPIVIIVPNKQLIKITTSGDFFRQNIGLYKIKTCSSLEIQDLVTLLLDLISSYCTYMSNLSQTAEYLYSLDKVKEYRFILKYGVFFKESYVFIDGLVDQGNIAGITVDLAYYVSYPYIPSDPSILPISILPSDLDGSKTTWNAYVMPKSVLNVSDTEYPNFVFSNPIKDWSFSTEPLPDNLRQLIEL